MNTMTSSSGFSSRLYAILILQPLGLDRQTSPLLLLLVIFGVTLAGSLWIFAGEVPVTAAIIYLLMLVLITFSRPDISLYMLLFLTLLLDQLQLTGFQPVTYYAEFFRNIKEISYLPEIGAAGFNPAELHISLLVFAWFIHFSLNPKITFASIPVWPAYLLFFGWFIFSIVYGLYKGGDFLVALWEVRAMFYMSILYLLVPQLIRTKKQIQIMMWVILAAVTIKAFQGLYRYASLGFSTSGFEALTNSEDTVFMVMLFVLLLAFLVFKVNHKQKIWLLIFLLPLALGFYAGQRRASFAALIVTFLVFVSLLPSQMQWSFLKRAFPVLAALLLYGFLFWNSTSPYAGPVQLVKSGIVTPDRYENMRDYHSNLYRDIENYNLSTTVKNNTILGVGFGNKYDMPVELVQIQFPLRDYIPHNQILWIYVKMGLVGFILFWYFFLSFSYKGVTIFVKLRDPYLKAIAAFVILAVINQIIVAFFDVMMTFYSNMIFLGCVMGLLPALEKLADDEQKKRKLNKVDANFKTKKKSNQLSRKQWFNG